MTYLTKLNLILAGFLSVFVNGDIYAKEVRYQLELAGESHGLEELQYSASDRKLQGDEDNSPQGDLHVDFSMFEGTWYDCMHTTLMTFNGEPASKHIVEQVGCDFGELGNVTKVGENDQTLMFDIYLLNHCWFHDLGGEGQKPCPNDKLESDERGDGNVIVKYSFKGIGSFAATDKIDFFADHTYIKDKDGNWKSDIKRSTYENIDTMECQAYLKGIVCDLKINEYRTSTTHTNACIHKGKCKTNWMKKRCSNKGGNWTKNDECHKVISDSNGLAYDSFGSYYLVKDTNDCDVTCPTTGPTPVPTNGTDVEDIAAWGCYRGGQCGEIANGCCDCSIDTEEECAETGKDWTTKPIWLSSCGSICKFI